MRISTVEKMREMDRRAAEEFGISEEILMENAGRAAYTVAARHLGVAGRRCAVFCGVGNNGGDGLVVARHLLSAGAVPVVFLVGDPGRFRGAARTNWEICRRLPLVVKAVSEAREIRSQVRHCHFVVDGLFGTGLDREVGGLHREVIELINEAARPVLSLDIPSGVSGETGEVLGAAVRADLTVTFGLPKIGNILYPGCGLAGRLFVCSLSFPPSLLEDESLQIAVNDSIPLPPRGRTVHKKQVGDVLFIAGAVGYYGAPYLAAMSFLKAGGGYARLAAPASMVPFLAGQGREIVFVPQEETKHGAISLSNREVLLNLAQQADMVVLGPGLSLADEARALVRELTARITKPLLIDGDGITAVAEQPEAIRERRAPTILTPHTGEMARLTNLPAGEIERRRIRVLQDAAMDLGAYLVLKGARSLIATPEGRIFVNLSGNPGMATAGSGDVLTGVIAAMYGLGLPLEGAVRKGVFLHGLAGDLAAEKKGEDGITAGDILDGLPYALKEDRSAGVFTQRYAIPFVD